MPSFSVSQHGEVLYQAQGQVYYTEVVLELFHARPKPYTTLSLQPTEHQYSDTSANE